MKRIFGPLAVATALACGGVAWAQQQTGGPGEATTSSAAPEVDTEGEEGDDSAQLPSARPAGPDWRTGHWIIAATAGAAIPAGYITGDVATRDLVADGFGFGGSIGIGISRYTVVGLSGSYALLPGACDGCRGNSYTVGAQFTYHLAQGIAFDPWVAVGASFRSSRFTADTRLASVQVNLQGEPFQGVDFIRLGLGGDFYPIPGFGFGAYLDAGVGTYAVRPQLDRGARVYGFIGVGARVAFDPRRWNWSASGSQVGLLR